MPAANIPWFLMAERPTPFVACYLSDCDYLLLLLSCVISGHTWQSSLAGIPATSHGNARAQLIQHEGWVSSKLKKYLIPDTQQLVKRVPGSLWYRTAADSYTQVPPSCSPGQSTQGTSFPFYLQGNGWVQTLPLSPWEQWMGHRLGKWSKQDSALPHCFPHVW
jgi:hypothetical protein